MTKYARDEFDKVPETASRQGVHPLGRQVNWTMPKGKFGKPQFPRHSVIISVSFFAYAVSPPLLSP